MTDWKARCAELLSAVTALHEQDVDAPYSPTQDAAYEDLISRTRAELAQPEPEGLPPGYIDAEHAGCDREMLEIFYKACRSEGGTADEIHLRGLRAVLALAQPEPEGLNDEVQRALVLAVSTLEGWNNHGDWVWPESALAQAKQGTTETLGILRDLLARYALPVPTSEPEVQP